MNAAEPHHEGANAGSLLGDSPERSFADKLERFNRFAAPELRALIACLPLAADRGSRHIPVGLGDVPSHGGHRQGHSATPTMPTTSGAGCESRAARSLRRNWVALIR